MASKISKPTQPQNDLPNECNSNETIQDQSLSADEQLDLFAAIIADLLLNDLNAQNDD